MATYPESEKLLAIKDKSQLIGEFLEWLGVEKDITLCKFQEAVRHSAEFGDFSPSGWYPRRGNTEELLADFFEIDLEELEEEKKAMLEELREAQPQEQAQEQTA